MSMVFKEVKEKEDNIWKYENEGDFVVGILVKKEEDVGTNNSKMYHIQQKNNTIAKVWGSIVLDNRMDQVKVGEVVKITYKGLGEAKPPKQAPKLFKVEHAVEEEAAPVPVEKVEGVPGQDLY